MARALAGEAWLHCTIAVTEQLAMLLLFFLLSLAEGSLTSYLFGKTSQSTQTDSEQQDQHSSRREPDDEGGRSAKVPEALGEEYEVLNFHYLVTTVRSISKLNFLRARG